MSKPAMNLPQKSVFSKTCYVIVSGKKKKNKNKKTADGLQCALPETTELNGSTAERSRAGRGLKTIPEPAEDPLRLPAAVRSGPPESSVSQSEDHRESRCWQDAKYHMAACLLLFSFSFFLFWTQKFVVLEAHMLISSVTLKTPCDGGAKLTFLCSLYLED